MRNKSHEICQGIVFHCSFVTIYVVNITAIGALRSCCSLADAATRKAAPSHPRPPRPFWAVWPRPWGPCPWSSWWTAWNSWHSPGSRRETEVILWLFGGKRTCLMMEVFFLRGEELLLLKHLKRISRCFETTKLDMEIRNKRGFKIRATGILNTASRHF